MEPTLSIVNQIGLSVILTFFLVFFFLYYTYSTCEYDYWKKQGVPGETAWPIVGTMKPKFIYKRTEILDQENHKKYGKIFGGFEGRNPVLYVVDLEILKQVMVKDFSIFTNRRMFEGLITNAVFRKMLFLLRNEEWKMTRAILSPTFSTGKLKQMMHIMEDCSRMLLKSLNQMTENKEPVDVKHCFSAFSLDVIARCAFGMKTNSMENPDTEFTVNARKSFKRPPFLNYLSFIIPHIFGILMKILGRFIQDPFEYFANVASDVINFRQEQKLKSQRKDFLDILIEAEQEEQNELDSTPVNRKKILTRTTMVANSVIFLLAGQEGISTTLSFFAYALATNSKVQDKLIEEIDEAMIECKGNLTYDIVVNLPYLDMVVSETLRMYPPAARTDRACGVDGFKLGEIVLKKETILVTSIYTIHHDEEHYPNPEVFDPERFTAENKAKRHPFAYMPFGAGPRHCIAMRFALSEVKLTMAYILSQFRFTTCDKTAIRLQITSGTGMIVPESIILHLEKRTVHPHFETEKK